MPTITINGPVVPSDAHNIVLREALFHSPVARRVSTSSYHLIEIGMREGSYTSWIGTWDQSTQKVDAASPTSILDVDRRGMRLKAGTAIVVQVTTTGSPASLEGSRINFTLALVGGRDGEAKPLIAAGALVADANTRTSLATIERQINSGGLSEWDDGVQLKDPVTLVVTGTFGGRLQRDSATQVSVQRYTGDWIEVDGVPMSIGSSGLVITTSDGLLVSTGSVSTTTPSSSTLYYVYVGSTDGLTPQIRLCATAPSMHRGSYHLGTDALTSRWRFVGWVRTNGSTQFVDTTTDRLVVNYYNRERKSLYVVPGYVDDNAATTYTTTSTTWTAANGGTGATASYIANGEDAIHVTAFSSCANSGANGTGIGIGDNSATSAAVTSGDVGTTVRSQSCSYSTIPATGYRTLVLLVVVTAGTGTFYADNARLGSTADPVLTGLYTMVPC